MRLTRTSWARRALVLLIGAVALVAGPTAAAAAGIEWTTTSDAAAPAVADGVRYVALMTRDGQVRVRDEGDGGDSFAIAVPAECDQARTRPSIEAIGGGSLLLSCISVGGAQQPDYIYRVLVLGERRWQSVPVAIGFGPFRIGSRWISASNVGSATVWTNWHTGEQRRDEATWRDAPDLDAAELMVRMCQPLRRELPDGVGGVAFEPYRYDAPFGVLDLRSVLAIQRCGQSRPVVLETNPWSGDTQLGSGVVTWTGRTLGAYLTRCGLRLTWSARLGEQVGSTRDAIWFARDGGTQLGRLALPSACPATARLTLAVGNHASRLRAVSGGWRSAALGGADVALLPTVVTPTPLRLRAGAIATLRSGARLTGLRWRVAGGRWQRAGAAARGGHSWRLRVPARTARIALDGRLANGGTVSWALDARVKRSR